MLAALAGATKVLALGIGGGGDVVGAVAVAEAARAVGTSAVVGGLTWERRPVDPLPGARTLGEIDGVERLNHAAGLAGPDTTGPGGFLFAESHVARVLGEPTVLLDPNPGPAAVGDAMADAAHRLGCDLVVLLDVGGDVLGHGDEPGLASPLADAVCLAGGARVEAAGLPVLLAVWGAGCDGELTPGEVLDRLAEVHAAGGGRGAVGLEPDALERLADVVREVPTEASAMALRCARGERGEVPIREGRRIVPLTLAGGLVFGLDPGVSVRTAARCAAAVADAGSLVEADALLRGRGIRTELDFERTAARPAG